MPLLTDEEEKVRKHIYEAALMNGTKDLHDKLKFMQVVWLEDVRKIKELEELLEDAYYRGAVDVHEEQPIGFEKWKEQALKRLNP